LLVVAGLAAAGVIAGLYFRRPAAKVAPAAPAAAPPKPDAVVAPIAAMPVDAGSAPAPAAAMPVDAASAPEAKNEPPRFDPTALDCAQSPPSPSATEPAEHLRSLLCTS